MRIFKTVILGFSEKEMYGTFDLINIIKTNENLGK
ncbi:hypothetical protein BACCIP111895_04529 [Neobacillus rhizosphaerae]|uniref:Uncharacterized protein n=1 Tax=Neobacillus rhizosphaerae TaxID=2880965 RepID=A0ABN8KY11_9BACI|nr:hypothetical protein BACCIP111895_04529 [Neobacillus rhizosphaerae]